MKLGEMLVRDGRIRAEDLDAMVQRQAREGGKLGSLLVAAELIDVETLTVYLGLDFGIPIATGATFERCKRSAVRTLSPEMAGRFKCIPIVIQGQTLIVAVDDPLDMQRLIEIGQETGYRIIPRVAPEIRIYYYLERFYGIAQPPPFCNLPDQRGDRNQDGEGLPAPPLPGLPPKVYDPTPPPTAQPELQITRASAAPTPVLDEQTGGHEALELDAADLVEELDADEEEQAGIAVEPSTTAEQEAPLAFDHDLAPDPVSLEEAIEIISNTEKRGDIAEAILGHAAELFEVAVLLLVRDEMAFGWKGFGPNLDHDRIETMLIPLERPSMFQVASGSGESEGEAGPFRARAFPGTLHTHWFRLLRCPTPIVSVVTQCTIGRRCVNLLYGHATDGCDLSDEQMQGLVQVMQAASDAYVRLISKSKKEKVAAMVNPQFGTAEVRNIVEDEDTAPMLNVD